VLRGEIDELAALLVRMQKARSTWPGQHRNGDAWLHPPAVAQPVSFAHHLLACGEMFAHAERLDAPPEPAAAGAAAQPAPATR
jgi:argininosuccinate lyase